MPKSRYNKQKDNSEKKWKNDARRKRRIDSADY